MKTKYALLTAEGEPNIAVIDITDEGCIQEKVVNALSEHFDCETEITSFEVIIETHPFKAVVKILLKELVWEEYPLTVELNETWVY